MGEMTAFTRPLMGGGSGHGGGLEGNKKKSPPPRCNWLPAGRLREGPPRGAQKIAAGAEASYVDCSSPLAASEWRTDVRDSEVEFYFPV